MEIYKGEMNMVNIRLVVKENARVLIEVNDALKPEISINDAIIFRDCLSELIRTGIKIEGIIEKPKATKEMV